MGESIEQAKVVLKENPDTGYFLIDTLPNYCVTIEPDNNELGMPRREVIERLRKLRLDQNILIGNLPVKEKLAYEEYAKIDSI